jgi:nucleoside-diphosphate-sugar epimerase
MSMVEIATALKDGLGEAARRVPTRRVPSWLLRVVSLWDPAVKQILPELGKVKNGTSAKAQRLLGWEPRSREDALVATAESLMRLGLLKDSTAEQAVGG